MAGHRGFFPQLLGLLQASGQLHTSPLSLSPSLLECTERTSDWTGSERPGQLSRPVIVAKAILQDTPGSSMEDGPHGGYSDKARTPGSTSCFVTALLGRFPPF